MLHLRRWSRSDVILPALTPPTDAKFSNDRALLSSYVQCNTTIAHLVETHFQTPGSACFALRSFLQPKSGAGFEIPAQTCSEACFREFKHDLTAAMHSCADAWKAFTSLASKRSEERHVADWFLRDIQRKFVARLGFIGDMVLKTELSCSHNLYQRSCLAVNQQIADVARDCQEYTVNNASLGSFEYTKPEYQRDGGAMICTSCPDTVRKIMEESHCCASTAILLKERLIGFFLPAGKQSLSLDVAQYNCIVQSECKLRGGEKASEGEQMMTVSKSAAACTSNSAPHLRCLAPACSVEYPWPAACCPWHECLNGGTRLYGGACWCHCIASFTGAHCTEKKAHVKLVLEFTVLHVMQFHEVLMQNFLAKSLAVDVSSVEMHSFSTRNERRATSGNVIILAGFRVLLPEGKGLLQFSRDVKYRVQGGLLNDAALGLGFKRLSLAEDPQAFSPDGFVCDETLGQCPEAEEEKLSMGSVVEETSSFQLALVLIIISSVFTAIICCCVGIFCRITKYRLIHGFVNYVSSPSKPNIMVDEDHENPLQRPSYMKFGHKAAREQKRATTHDVKNDLDKSDSASLKSARTGRSSIKFSRVGTDGDANSSWDDGSSVRSAFTLRSTLTRSYDVSVSPKFRMSAIRSVGGQHETRSRVPTHEAASCLEPREMRSGTSMVENSFSLSAFSPSKSEPPASPAGDTLNCSVRSVKFESDVVTETQRLSLLNQNLSNRTTTFHQRFTRDNFQNLKSQRRYQEEIELLQHLKLNHKLKQQSLMELAAVANPTMPSLALSRNTTGQTKRDASPVLPVTARSIDTDSVLGTRSQNWREKKTLSSGLAEISEVENLGDADPWQNRGRPMQLWEPAASISTPQRIFRRCE